MVVMVCRTGTIYGRQYTYTYGRHMDHEGEYHNVWKLRRVMCEECGTELSAVSMATHLQTHHVRSDWVITLLLKLPTPIPNEYTVAFMQTYISINFLVEGCPEKTTSCTELRLNFMHQYVEDTILILNKGTVTHPPYYQCVIFMPWETLESEHLGKFF